MAKSSKATKSAEKRKARALKKTQYAAEAAQGKAKKFQNALSSFSANKHRHMQPGSCGNLGCGICFPQYQPH